MDSRTTSLWTCNLLKSIEHLHHYDDLYDFHDVFMIIVMIFFHQKILFFFVCMYKMFNIDKETYENNDIEAIVDGIGTLWLNEKHREEKLGHKSYQPSQTNTIKCIKSTDMN